MASPEARSKKSIKTLNEIKASLARIEAALGITPESEPAPASGMTPELAAKMNAELKGDPTPPNLDTTGNPPRKGK